MLQEAMNAVRDFHYDKGISPRQDMPESDLMDMPLPIMMAGELKEFKDAVLALKKAAEGLEPYLKACDDPRIVRMHLEGEEFAEHMIAMWEGKTVEAFDGLIDLLYVAIGTGVVFDWPLAAGFSEVQRSNMTKAGRIGPRLRDKGNKYSPPQLANILTAHQHRHSEYPAGLIYFSNDGGCCAGDCETASGATPSELNGESKV